MNFVKKMYKKKRRKDRKSEMRIKSGRIYRYDASAAAVGGRCPCRAAGEPRGT